MSTLTPPAYREPAEPRPVKQPSSRMAKLVGRVVVLLSLANFAVVTALLILLCVVSEDWWLSLALSYLPRLPYLFPSAMLAGAALLLRRRIVWLNLFSALLVLGPVMGFRAPLSTLLATGTGTPLTVISYNVQGGVGEIDSVLAELIAAAPDVIVLQEASRGVGPIKEHFHDWHLAHAGEYLILARWPVQMKDACRTEGFGRATAVLYEVAAPARRFLVCNVHLTTARYGLSRLRPDSLVSGHGIDALKRHQASRDLETKQTSEFVADIVAETPLLVVGDFNIPTSSSLFQKHWSDLTSAFDAAGLGYGYTSPCNTTGNSWPRNTPWLRIDHILLSDHWEADSCSVGKTNGSDHRCIVASVRLR